MLLYFSYRREVFCDIVFFYVWHFPWHVSWKVEKKTLRMIPFRICDRLSNTSMTSFKFQMYNKICDWSNINGSLIFVGRLAYNNAEIASSWPYNSIFPSTGKKLANLTSVHSCTLRSLIQGEALIKGQYSSVQTKYNKSRFKVMATYLQQ